MGGAMSRNKGQRGEREVIKLLQPTVTRCYMEKGLDVPSLERNLMQSRAGGFDIVGLEWMALEVKRQEVLNVNLWWKQTCAQAGTDLLGQPLLQPDGRRFGIVPGKQVFVNKYGNPLLNRPVEQSRSEEDVTNSVVVGPAQIRVPILFYRRNQEPWSVRMLGRLYTDSKQFRTVVTVNAQQFLAWFEMKLQENLGTIVSLAEDLRADEEV